MRKLASTLLILALLSTLFVSVAAAQQSDTASSTGRSPRIDAPDETQPVVPLNPGPPAYGLDVYPGFQLVYWPDLGIPGTWNLIGSRPEFHPAGDFLGSNFDLMYALDYDTNQFVSIDVNTNTRTVIATTTPNGNWTGMTGTIDGATLYASSSVCGVSSTLYTINPATGALSMVGPVTNATCLIDIAISSTGLMYGVDIVNDNLVQIDPGTGAGTVVGYIGFNANYAQGLDFDQATDTLYFAAFNSTAFRGELRTVNLANGSTTLIGPFPNNAEIDALSIESGAPVNYVFATHVRIIPLGAPQLLLGLVRVATGNGATPIPGATVDVEWTIPLGGGYVVPQTRTTNANGFAFPIMVANWPGTYVLDLLNITAAGYTYDPGMNWESSASYTRP